MFNFIQFKNMVKFTRVTIGLLLVMFSFFTAVHAQCPDASFSITQPVCPQQDITFTNSSTSAVSYQWDFCAGDFNSGLFTKFDTATPVNIASYAVAVIDGPDHYGFLCGRNNDNLVRLDFGNSFSNAPFINDLGNPQGVFSSPVGLAFHQEGGIWYAIEISLYNSTATLYTFGSGLANAPTAATAITVPGLSQPRSLDLTVEGGNVFAAFMNNANDQLVIADFGPSITNATPTVNSYTVTGIASGWGVAFAHSCNLSCVFVTSYALSAMMRVDFTNTLQNAPTAVTTLPTSLFLPSGLSVVSENGRWTAIVSSYVGGVISIVDIGTDLLNNTPTLLSSYTVPGASSLNGLTTIKENSDWLIAVADESVSKFVGVVPQNNCSANQQVSTDQVPLNVQYNLDGTYHIALEAYDANGNVDLFGDSIVIAPAPVVVFTFENLCEGDFVQFYDSSTLSSGTITNRHWDFGDSDTSDVVNPTHQYAATGTYPVTLTLTANSGCTSALTQSVTISARPFANFTLPVGCSDSLLNFTDASSISSGSITNWLWTFGNGDSLSTQNPTYAFPDGGGFDITLLVTSDSGCTDDTTYNLGINPSPDAAFIVDNTCVGQSVTFTDQTVSQSPVTSYSWDFGDSNTSNLASPSHTYATGVPFTYNVVFVVQAQNSCSDYVTIPVRISNPPTANFIYSPGSACENNMVTFTDLSTGNGDTISGWSWDFGDGFSDSIESPMHEFTTADTFHVSLIAYSPSNCPSPPSTQDIIVNQGAIVNIGYSEVCLGFPIPFTDLSSPPPGDTVVSRLWLFDGVDTSTQANPLYLFATPGLHQVILTVTTNLGCTSADTITLTVHDNPTAAFSYINACTDFPTIFTDNSTVDSLAYIAMYEWNFGDPGDTNNTSALANPTHTYDSAVVGMHNVTLIVTDNFGCRDSILQTLDVNFSVIPNFAYSPTCLGGIMSFTNFSRNANLDSTWTWNFGDQQTQAIENPAHYYVYAGTYTVTLTALSVDGCLSSASKDVTVSAIPVADFSTPPACIHTPYQFTDNSTVSNGVIDTWTWTFDTLGTDTNQNPVFTFDTIGVYSVNLVVETSIGCIDSVRKNVTVHALPVPNFSFSPQYGNPPLDVAFTNLTNLTSTYTWDFGDGAQISTVPSPHHIYQDTGRYSIELIATTAFGCVDSITKSIYVIRPLLDAAVTNVSATLINGQLSIQANIANLGTVDIDSVIMQAQLEDGTVIQESYQQLLPNGSNGIQSYSFVARFNIAPSSNVSFYCVSVIKPNGQNDDVESNNQKCSSLTNEISIMEPYPNPFSDELQVNVILPYDDYLTVEIYSYLGQKIKTLYDGMGKTGLNAINVDFSSLSGGVYIIRYIFRDQEIKRKVIKQSKKK